MKLDCNSWGDVSKRRLWENHCVLSRSANNELVINEPLLSSKDALDLILSKLQSGSNVLLGDTHIELPHHIFYALAVKHAKDRGINFISGLELPTQAENELNYLLFDSHEPIKLDKIPSLGKPVLKEFQFSLEKFILPVLRTTDVPLVLLDMYPRPSNTPEGDDLVNKFMAGSLINAKERYRNLPILGLIGAYHLQQSAIPQYFDNSLVLHLGVNGTFYDDPNIAIYSPGDFDGIVDLPKRTLVYLPT